MITEQEAVRVRHQPRAVLSPTAHIHYTEASGLCGQVFLFALLVFPFCILLFFCFNMRYTTLLTSASAALLPVDGRIDHLEQNLNILY